MPVDYTTYPTGDDLLLKWQSTGIVKNPPSGASALIDWDAKMASAISEWENSTGWKPFLASEDAQSSTTTYTARQVKRGILRLSNGLLSLSSLTIDGSAMVSGADYEAAESGPVRRLRFPSAVSGTIEITGIAGYSTSLPADVREVLLERAMFRCFPELALKISGGRTGIKAGKVALEFVRSSGNRSSSGGPLSGEAAVWEKNWNTKVLEYRR